MNTAFSQFTIQEVKISVIVDIFGDCVIVLFQWNLDDFLDLPQVELKNFREQATFKRSGLYNLGSFSWKK